jgi:predicted DNA-binding protein (UPF0251 family)
MSPRPVRLRKISNPPVISGFKPYGKEGPAGDNGNVFLYLEEYEALRLCDYEMLNHHQASMIMNVSRPTLTRIYARARQKIAEALVKGVPIIIEGGKIYFDSEWFSCAKCGCYFNNPEKLERIAECPLCRSTEFSSYEPEYAQSEEADAGCNDQCVCPSCGFEQPHHFRRPCRIEICPECGQNMVRKGTPKSRKFNT